MKLLPRIHRWSNRMNLSIGVRWLRPMIGILISNSNLCKIPNKCRNNRHHRRLGVINNVDTEQEEIEGGHPLTATMADPGTIINKMDAQDKVKEQYDIKWVRVRIFWKDFYNFFWINFFFVMKNQNVAYIFISFFFSRHILPRQQQLSERISATFLEQQRRK